MSSTLEATDRSIRTHLEPRAELAVLARALNRDGYCEHNAGHISVRTEQDTLLVTPRGLAWDELHASDIMHIDLEGKIIDGIWDVAPSLELHYALHGTRKAGVVVHQHPEWCTVWACAGEIPEVYDQTSTYGGPVVLVAEYDGEFSNPNVAERTVSLLGQNNTALLANHGALVIGDNIRQAHQRAVALEWRCRLAWRVRALNGPNTKPMNPELVSVMQKDLDARGGYQPYLFDAMARREIRLDPTVVN